MIYAKSYGGAAYTKPHHVTVDGVRVLLTPIPWGWRVVLDGVPIGSIWRGVYYTDATGTEYIMWNACEEPCPEGDSYNQMNWLNEHGGGDLHETQRKAISAVVRRQQ